MKLHLICQIAMYCKTALTLKAKKNNGRYP